MKLVGLHINRFGARAGLELTDIAEHLNVIYGPNGAGKTTVIQFLRWAFYGHRDEMTTRYLRTGDVVARGSIELVDGHRRQTLERSDHRDGLQNTLTKLGSTTPAQLPTALSRNEFDRFFTINLDQPRDVLSLLRSASHDGLPLRHDQRQLDRMEQLAKEIAELQHELSGLRYLSESRNTMLDRRSDLECQLDELRATQARERHELEARRQDLQLEVEEQRSLVGRLERVLNNVTAAIDHRKQHLATESQQRTEARQQANERRGMRLREIDAQVARWQEILEEIRSRLQDVRARISIFSDVQPSFTNVNDIHFFLRTLGLRIRDAEHDLTGVYEHESWRDYEADASYLRGLLGSALNSMRDDVARLCQIVESQQQSQELAECREELNYLCRAEKELTDLVDALHRQRDLLDRESDLLWTNERALGASGEHRVNGVSLIPSSDDAIHDFRLRHLLERCDAARARHSAAALELTERERRLRELEDRLSGSFSDARLADVERQILDTEAILAELDRREALTHEIARREDELQRHQIDLSPSPLLEEATKIFRQLTDGEYLEVSVSDSWQCHVLDRRNRTFDHTQLSRGVHDQLYMSLGIAIVAAFRRKGIDAPVILNDVFCNMDQSATDALVDLLVNIARQGQQILLFTRHEHIRARLESTTARVFRLESTEQTDRRPRAHGTRPIAELPPITPDPTYRWIAEWQRSPEPAPPVPPAAPRPSESPKSEVLPPRPNENDLSVSHLLTAVPTLDRELVRYLAKLHIGTIGEFLELDADDGQAALGKHGITADIIQRRQREILMMLHVGVSPLEAQLLVACGVPDPERLGRADEAVLLKRVETILERPQAVERFGELSRYTLARIRRWIDAARRSNYRARARRRPRIQVAPKAVLPQTPTVPINTGRSHRFYLDVNDPVVDAPSIGPKTAEKLNAIDIYTVGHLLDLDGEFVATKLDDRRISPDHVAQWQLQSKLVCRIPNLRGHDAQILVACGVEDPVTLATLEPSAFLKQVKKFVSTKDGQRILRGAKRPDLAEVTAWIEWADSARQLRAA